jgi:serine/threonine protein kinase
LTPDTVSIPGYFLERLLGEGSHGRVFLARETEGLRRLVALKVFSRESRSDFERELEAVRRVEEIRRRERAGELVQALGSGEGDGLSWIALEYLESGSLADLVSRQGPLSLDQALEAARETARGLILLHRAGIFHRDVKPHNLLLGSDGHVRLGDFGLSRSLDGTLSAAGSPAFAAPEVIAGKCISGEQADVYSLGATVIFLLTGETILPGCPDLFALERRSVPRPLQQALVEATTASPRERLSTVEAFMQRLDASIQEISRTKTAPPDVSPGGRENMVEAPVEAPRIVATWSKKSVASLACAVLVLLLGFALKGYALFVRATPTAESTLELERPRAESAREPEPKTPPVVKAPEEAPKKAERPAEPPAPQGELNLPDRELPWGRFCDSEQGDWATFVTHETSSDAPVDTRGREQRTITRLVIAEVKDPEERLSPQGTNVRVDETERVEKAGAATEKTTHETASTRWAPGITLKEFLHASDPFVVRDWRFDTHARYRISDEEFVCTKGSFVIEEGDHGRSEVVIWFNCDYDDPKGPLKGSGLIALSRKGRRGGAPYSTLQELAGYGTRTHTLWGRTYEELAKGPEEGAPATDTTRLPLNVLPGAKEGDWTFFAGHSIRKGSDIRGIKAFHVHVVEKTAKDSVTFGETGSQTLPLGEMTSRVTFAARSASTIALCNLPELLLETKRITRNSVEDATYEIGSEQFSCKKACYTLSDSRDVWKLSVWMSPRVKGSGIVAFELRTSILSDQTNDEQGRRLVLAGYGSKGTTEWGKSPDELARDE